MEQALQDGLEQRILQNALDRLSQKKLSWDEFNKKVDNLWLVSRLNATRGGRTLLHLAVLDEQMDIVQTLSSDPILKLRRDAFGLSPVDIAQLLHRREALRLLYRPQAQIEDVGPFPREFEVLAHPIFETKEGFEEVLAYGAKAKEEDKIPAEKIWMGIYFDKEIGRGSHPPLSIRYIDTEVGFGVFAEKKIPPCTYIGEYTGVVQERKSNQLKEKKHCLRYTLWEGKKNFTIDAEEKGNFTRFINHSSKPNLGLQAIYWRGIPRMILIALREIDAGNQLTVDYGPIFWKHHSQTPVEFDDDH